MNKTKILNLLSMAQRANKVVSGDFAVTKAVQGRKALLMIVAEDASEETKKSYQRMADDAEINVYYLFDREELGHCIGKDFRAVAAIMDKGFADALSKLFEDR